jgi:hypothetical protein
MKLVIARSNAIEKDNQRKILSLQKQNIDINVIIKTQTSAPINGKYLAKVGVILSNAIYLVLII